MSKDSKTPLKFASRAGEKLDHALESLGISVAGLTVADLGCSTGGFVDCLLSRGAARVYAVDTAYGELAWKLRNDSRVVVMERTNALHVTLPEPVDLVTVDCGWTKQEKILPKVITLLKPAGRALTLVKPHYEAGEGQRSGGAVVDDAALTSILEQVRSRVTDLAFTIEATVDSPLVGKRGENREIFFYLSRNC